MTALCEPVIIFDATRKNMQIDEKLKLDCAWSLVYNAKHVNLHTFSPFVQQSVLLKPIFSFLKILLIDLFLFHSPKLHYYVFIYVSMADSCKKGSTGEVR